MFPLSEVVLMIPRCVALSTDGILLGPKVKESDKMGYLVVTYTNSTSINFLICTEQLGLDTE
jgi:hypothetical protein